MTDNADQNRRNQYLKIMGIQVWVRRHLPPTLVEDLPMNGDYAPENQVTDEVVALEHTPLHTQTPLLPESQNATIASPSHTLIEESPQPLINWHDLQNQVAACTACVLHQTRTQTVFGTGNPQTDWLFVGEAPGADEDAQGEPFVGRAGQLLNNMLYAIELKREEVYIANVVKCRPPENRNPKNEEMASCQAFLQQQIRFIQPKLIIALGRVAAQHLLATNTPIGKLRGQCFEYETIPLIATYHPAYLLRRPSEKRRAWEDWQWIHQMMMTLKT